MYSCCFWGCVTKKPELCFRKRSFNVVEFICRSKFSVCNLRLFMLMFKSDYFTDVTVFMASSEYNMKLNCLFLFISIPSLIPRFSLFFHPSCRIVPLLIPTLLFFLNLLHQVYLVFFFPLLLSSLWLRVKTLRRTTCMLSRLGTNYLHTYTLNCLVTTATVCVCLYLAPCVYLPAF